MKSMMKKIGCVIFVGLLILVAVNACNHGDGGTQDSDNDGLSDTDEVQVYGTDPYKGDTDGDGRSDGEEVLVGTNPLAADYARALTLNNTSSDDVTVYIVFIGGVTGNGGSYTFKYFQDQGCDNSYDPARRQDRCSITIPKKVEQKR